MILSLASVVLFLMGFDSFVCKQDSFAKKMLNPAQLQAVTSPLGSSVLCKAGPGSGKTQVLTNRIEHLVKERMQPPSSILALTFSNKAAREMKQRLHTVLGGDVTEKMYIGTFHGFGSRLLRKIGAPYLTHADENFSILDQQSSESIIKELLKNSKISDGFKPKLVLKCMNRLREIDALKTSKTAAECVYDIINLKSSYYLVAAEIIAKYEERLAAINAIDFEGLLLSSYQLLVGVDKVKEKALARWRHILVDEFQDTSIIQMEIVKLLAPAIELQGESGECTIRSLFVVGDKNQAIYSWRGARPSNMDGLQEDYSSIRTISLLENYRSTIPIVSAANAILGMKGTESVCRSEDSIDPVRVVNCLDGADQADFIAKVIQTLEKTGNNPRSIAVIYRTNEESREIEEVLVSKGIPYTLVSGTKFYDRKEIREVVSFLRVIQNPYDKDALSLAMGDPAKGVGVKTRETFFRNVEVKNAETALTLTTPAISALTLLMSLSAYEEKRVVSFKDYFSARELKVLVPFSAQIVRLQHCAENKSLPALVEEITAIFFNDEYLRRISKTDEEASSRKENILKLVAATKRYHNENDGYGTKLSGSLGKFLEDVSLLGGGLGDEGYLFDKSTSYMVSKERTKNSVYLMTIHASKGKWSMLTHF